MEVSEGSSNKVLVVRSKECVDEEIDHKTAMRALVDAATEARDGNIKKSSFALSQGLKECGGSDDLFLSKLTELDFQDLEMLYVVFCGPDKKRKGSSKIGSFKKKSSVGDSSFTNEGFETEFKTDQQNSWGRKRKSPVNLSDESENSMYCLCKAYRLNREFKATKSSEVLRILLEIHTKVANYHPCVQLLTACQANVAEEYVSELKDEEKNILCELSVSIVMDILKDGHIPDTREGNECIKYCLFAIKLFPNIMKPHSILCYIHKIRDETNQALRIATTFLQEVDPKDDHMMLILVLCQVDENKTESVLKRLNAMEQNGLCLSTNIVVARGFMLILINQTKNGVKMLTDLKLIDDKESIERVLGLMKCDQLKDIVENTMIYIQEEIEKNMNSRNETIVNQIQEEREFLKSISQIFSRRDPTDLTFAKIYIDSLMICEEFSIIENYLSNLIKLKSLEILPIVYLANCRLKIGAYNAACEDFRALLQFTSEEELSKGIRQLPVEDRMEIARVLRLRGFRYLEKEFAFEDSIECFSVAISAIGKSALGIVLTRGYCYMHINDFEKAGIDLDVCLQQDKMSVPALCARAVLFAVTTHMDKAMEYFQNAFRSSTTSSYQSFIKLPLEHVLVFSQLLIQFVKQEIERVGNCKQTNSERDTLSNEGCWKDYRNEPSGSDFDDQILGYSEFLVDLFPENIDYICTRIACLFISSGSAAALFETKQALMKFSGEECLIIWKGVLLLDQQQYDEAINELKDYKSSDTLVETLRYLKTEQRNQFLDVLRNKANSYKESECFQNALVLYNFLIALSNKNIDALRGRLECFDRLGETKNWLRDLNETMSLQPTSDHACLRAQHYIKNGKDEHACDDYIKALELNEKNTINIVSKVTGVESVSQLFYRLALNSLEQKSIEEVSKYCDAGLKFNPNDKSLKQLKERISTNANKCVIQ